MNIIQNKIGYVYVVSSNLLDAVKIGMWRSNIDSLYSRYITCYGKNIHIDYFLTSDARKLENETHKYFNKYQITNELFDKIHYNKYIDFIQNNIDEPVEQLTYNSFSNISDSEVCDTNYCEMKETIFLLENKVLLLTKLLSANL